MGGHFAEGRAWIEESVDKAAHSPWRARALCAAGKLAFLQGDFGSAERILTQALQGAREADDSALTALALLHLGLVASYRNDLAGALHSLEQSLQIQRELRDSQGIAQALMHLAMVYSFMLDFAGADQRYREASALFRALDDQGNLALSLYYTAENIVTMQRDFDRAEPLYNESLAISQATGQSNLLAYALWGKGNVACERGDLATAARFYHESGLLIDDIQHDWGLIYAIEAFGYLATIQQNYIRSAQLLGAASALRLQMNSPLLPPYHARHQRYLHMLQDGMDKSTFDSEWNAGTTLSMADAWQLAQQSPLLTHPKQ